MINLWIIRQPSGFIHITDLFVMILKPFHPKL